MSHGKFFPPWFLILLHLFSQFFGWQDPTSWLMLIVEFFCKKSFSFREHSSSIKWKRLLKKVERVGRYIIFFILSKKTPNPPYQKMFLRSSSFADTQICRISCASDHKVHFILHGQEWTNFELMVWVFQTKQYLQISWQTLAHCLKIRSLPWD